jgi:hypothetical protein
MAPVIFIMLMRRVYFSVYNPANLHFLRRVLHGGIKSKQQVTVLLMCNADGSDKLSPLVTGKHRSPRCFKNVMRLPTKYEANINSWMTTKIYEDFLTQLDRKLGAKNPIIDQCAAHPKNTTLLSNIKVAFLPANHTSQLQPSDLAIIQAFKCHYR